MWVDARRIQRIEHIAALSRGESVSSAASPTGYAGGIRERVLPDHDGRSYEWIAQTQRLLAGGAWRVRSIEDENAPFGRATHAASPYRWWLALVAWTNHWLTGSPSGIAVERAALYADPALHLLILIATTLFAARHFGAWPATIAALGGATLFPFAISFLPGVPEDSTLSLLFALGSLLPLLAGIRATDQTDPRHSSLWFCLAGIFGGLGLWINPAAQVPLNLGLALGALLVAWIRRMPVRGPAETPLPWRLWSLAGAITVLAASLLEFFPGHLGDWESRAVHPLYGLAWLGGGELLARTTGWIEHRSVSWRPLDLVVKLLALAALLSVPLMMLRTGNPGFLAADPLSLRLTRQPDGVMASNVFSWLREDGFSHAACATLLPLGLLAAALGLLAQRRIARPARTTLALLLGTVIPLLALAGLQLKSWALLDAGLLAQLIVVTHTWVTTAGNRFVRDLGAGGLLLLLLPGAFQLIPPARSLTDNALTVPEALGLAERDLAHWLAQRRPVDDRAVVLAPPNLTTALNYYGGLRGLGTLSWENQAGLRFAVRLAISTNRAETIVLLRQRGVTHVVVPSWDPFFDSYLDSASVQLGEMFYRGLNRWALPPWLRPVPYQLPAIPGFEKQYVRIFEVVDEQDEPVAASRLTEYFIEQGEWANAKASGQALLKYPADFGVQIARAQLWAALNDAANFTPVFEPLLQRLETGGDRYLPWDRRVSLALVLARGNRLPLAQVQAQRCLAEINETRLRALSTNALYQLLALNKLLGLEIADPRLRALALELLPSSVRERL